MKKAKWPHQWSSYQEEVSRVVDDAFVLMCRDIWTAIHLWYNPGPEGGLCAAAEQPEGYELATAVRFPQNMTKEQLARWVHEHVRRLPCLPKEG